MSDVVGPNVARMRKWDASTLRLMSAIPLKLFALKSAAGAATAKSNGAISTTSPIRFGLVLVVRIASLSWTWQRPQLIGPDLEITGRTAILSERPKATRQSQKVRKMGGAIPASD